MKSDKNCPGIRDLVNVYNQWGSLWTPPGRMRVKVTWLVLAFFHRSATIVKPYKTLIPIHRLLGSLVEDNRLGKVK